MLLSAGLALWLAGGATRASGAAGSPRAGAPVAPASSPVSGSVSRRSCPDDWPKYCGDLAMTGTSGCDKGLLHPASAKGLSLLWYRYLPGAVASQPTVSGGRLFVGDWSGVEWALDPASGAVLASRFLGTTHAPQCNPPDLGITSGPAAAADRIYLAGGDGSFYCLDASTLDVVWATVLGDNSASGGYYGWCSPAVTAGVVLQGVSSNCDDPFVQGEVVSMDSATGAIRAAANLSESDDPAHFGAGVWSSPAVDPRSGEVFVTTASGYHYEDGLGYSVVRLSFPDLAIEDSWKVVLPELFDADWGSSPTLFTDRQGRSLVGAGSKDGTYYAFLREDLSAGPVWTAAVARSGDCPQCGDGTLSTAAFDGAWLYVGGGATPDGVSPAGPGSVVALDPATGAVRWRFTGFDGPVIAPVSISHGVVLAAGGKTAVALDASSGELLWSYQVSGDANGLFGGIAVAGGRIYFGDLSGTLYCFAPAQ